MIPVPTPDDALVSRLAAIVDRLDGTPESESGELLAELNAGLAGYGATLAWRDLQGIYKSEDADDFVRRTLVIAAAASAEPVAIGRPELVELFPALDVGTWEGDIRGFDDYVTTVIETVRRSLGVNISDAIYWPNEFYGDGDLHKKRTAAEFADTVLAKTGLDRTLQDSAR